MPMARHQLCMNGIEAAYEHNNHDLLVVVLLIPFLPRLQSSLKCKENYYTNNLHNIQQQEQQIIM